MEKKTVNKLETISFRGNRQLWLDFTYLLRKRGETNTWNTLSKMIKKFIDSGGKI